MAAIYYSQSTQVLGMANSGNCDNGVCRLDGLVVQHVRPRKLLSTTQFGTNIPLASDQARTVTAADGNTFNQISTNNKSSIDFQNAGVSIKSMILGSGRQVVTRYVLPLVSTGLRL